jgi:hypothetical protein
MMSEEEEFKKINGIYYMKDYSVSNFGNIRNDTTNVLESIKINKQGYLYVKIRGCRNEYTESVHRLVAKTFINNQENHKFVRHLDNNKLNNNANNLQWYSNKKYNKIYKNK